MADQQKMDKLVALAKRRGFFYPGSELYGGLANTYDYGPMGAELLRNLRNLWWKFFVQERPDIVGLDASIISHHAIWDASGHTAGFSDAMIDCRNCNLRKRADHLIEEYLDEKNPKSIPSVMQNGAKQSEASLALGDSSESKDPSTELRMTEKEDEKTGLSQDKIESALKDHKVEGWSPAEMDPIIAALKIPCPNCGEVDWTPVRKFNLLFPVHLGIVEGDQSLAYLRGETAQGMFVNFKNVVDSTRVKLPFGIAQLGKSFRNEITLGNSIFRTIEFEQGEIEYFFDPDATAWEPLFADWKRQMFTFVTEKLGVKKENLRWREHSDDERSFYSKRTEDLEYNFPFGFKELWGLAYRTDYDLGQHQKHSGKDLTITDPQTGRKILPHVIEPAVGITRLALMTLLDAYTEDGERTVLKLHPNLAPYKAAVFPLLANKPELVEKAKAIFDSLKSDFTIAWDDRGNIGKRYLAQDEIGTPFCITVDFDTLEDDTVTIRHRDTTKQDRIKITEIPTYLRHT